MKKTKKLSKTTDLLIYLERPVSVITPLSISDKLKLNTRAAEFKFLILNYRNNRFRLLHKLTMVTIHRFTETGLSKYQ